MEKARQNANRIKINKNMHGAWRIELVRNVRMSQIEMFLLFNSAFGLMFAVAVPGNWIDNNYFFIECAR